GPIAPDAVAPLPLRATDAPMAVDSDPRLQALLKRLPQAFLDCLTRPRRHLLLLGAGAAMTSS
ncbi:MAG TPA: hypothetical protein DEP84_36690, partial [Chloroflexi bacterium]|nr:hypothetical protein [Chloroflexota bacterium]